MLRFHWGSHSTRNRLAGREFFTRIILGTTLRVIPLSIRGKEGKWKKISFFILICEMVKLQDVCCDEVLNLKSWMPMEYEKRDRFIFFISPGLKRGQWALSDLRNNQRPGALWRLVHGTEAARLRSISVHLPTGISLFVGNIQSWAGRLALWTGDFRSCHIIIQKFYLLTR